MCEERRSVYEHGKIFSSGGVWSVLSVPKNDPPVSLGALHHLNSNISPFGDTLRARPNFSVSRWNRMHPHTYPARCVHKGPNSLALLGRGVSSTFLSFGIPIAHIHHGGTVDH